MTRRRPRHSIRCMLGLICMLLTCSGCQSATDRLVERAKENQDLSVTVRDRQGMEYVDVRITGQEALHATLPILDGVNVVVLGIANTKLSRDDLMQVSRLPLRELSLGMCRASIDDLKILGQINSLEEFNSSPSLFTDDDLDFIQELTTLQRLQLNGPKIEGFGLRYLEGLNSLSEIRLTNCPISDEGLANLPRLPSLKAIWLVQTNVTPTGLQHLTTFTTLEKVYDPGILSTEALALRQMHLDAREQGQERGIPVSSNSIVPYDGYANMIEKDRRSLDQQIIRERSEKNAIQSLP